MFTKVCRGFNGGRATREDWFMSGAVGDVAGGRRRKCEGEGFGQGKDF